MEIYTFFQKWLARRLPKLPLMHGYHFPGHPQLPVPPNGLGCVTVLYSVRPPWLSYICQLLIWQRYAWLRKAIETHFTDIFRLLSTPVLHSTLLVYHPQATTTRQPASYHEP